MVPGAATARLMHLASLPFDRILPHVPGHLEYTLLQQASQAGVTMGDHGELSR